MNALVHGRRRSLAVLLFFLCLHATSWGQVKANFSGSPLSGCSPLVVYFFDSSTGGPVQWRWDLGNGVTSFLRNPSATYFNPGTYTIKLVVSGVAGKDSIVKTKYVTVYDNPKVDFSLDKSIGCFPLPVQFSDKSTPGSGSIASWQWDFGDGTISSQQNPSHTYTAAGNFTNTLKVTNSFGCVKSFTAAQTITIANGVKAGFNFTDPGLCPAPATSQFTNTTTGPGPLQYQWSFGDGATSTDTDPVHAYNSNGTYSVKLIATSPQGCVDTVTKTDIFKIGSAKAAFTFSSSVCVNNPVQFTNASNPAPTSVKWDFGDATYSTALNPVKTYPGPGMFTVKLISNFGACSDTAKNLISIEAKPKADFSVQQTAFCTLPVAVQFTSLSTGYNYKYAWDFGDGGTAITATPSHVYTQEGTYTIRLIVTNAGGCSDTIVKKDLVQIQKPKIFIQGVPQTGCSPQTILPTATVSGNLTITNYLWDFGDGTTSTAANPSHVYSTAGNFDIRLIATTSGGCTDTIILRRAVRVGDKPHANFLHAPVTVCPYEKVFFTDKSSGTVDQWFWNFGDGGTSSLQNPFHQYSDTGWQNVTLVVYSNTCPDTMILKNAVYVNPPVALFTVKDDCNAKFTKTFTDQSLKPETWFWMFGDGTTSTEQNPVHTYASPGTYAVQLTVTNGTCSHFQIKAVKVIDEKAVFSAQDSVICRNSTAYFTSTGINSDNITSWQWDFGDGVTSTAANATQHLYAKSGRYTVTLTITDLLGCQSTKSMVMNVYGPVASFKPSVAATCLKDNLVTFIDSSQSDGQHPLVRWLWNYGDGTIDSTSTIPYQHAYATAGNYTIWLVVRDGYGCADTTVQTGAVVVAQPAARFSIPDSVTCTDKSVHFINESTGISPSYAWSFGDGSSSTGTNPAHAYSSTGVYAVKLVVTDQYGCTDSIQKQNGVTVSYPKAAFTMSDSTGTCPPLLVHFTNESTDYKSLYWDFGDGNTSTLDTPSHFYSFPGTFYPTLVATGPGGCTDTVRKKIVVKGPSGSFTYAPLTGCKPLTVDFTASTKNNASFIWDFSDGSTNAGKSKTTSHTYVSAGDFVPKIILTDSAGCSVPIVGEDTIRVKGVTIDFDMNATQFCDDGFLQFNNHTVGNDLITDYQWNFGDGNTSTDTNPLHHYAAPGLYNVQLQVKTESGCIETKVLTDTVKVYSSPLVKITGDSAGCAPANFSFQGNVNRGNPALLKWAWDFANGNTANVQTPSPQAYAVDGTFNISTIATDDHGCADTVTKAVTVYPIPATNAGADAWICRGSVQPLKATGAATYSWQPAASLSCTDCDGPLAAPTDSTQYIVTGYSSFGCSKSDSVTVRVHQPFTLTVEKGDTICAGKVIRLAATGADKYTWTPSLNVKDPSAGITTATPQINTLYTVTAKDNFNCFTDSASVFIRVWPMPTIDVQIVQTLSIGNTLTLSPKYSADITSYQWNNAQTLSCVTCPSPVARPKTETKYTVAVQNDGGCKADASVTVHVICNDGNLFIPNTFTPNTDGKNDRFYPRGTGISKIKSLKIYNRWGEMVFNGENFDANNAAAGWDGTFKGQTLTPDVYVYTCEVVCMNNEVLTFKGDVSLLR